MKRIEAIFKKIDLVFKWLSAIILGGMTLAIFLQVIFRYVFKSPLSWSEELARFLFIWMTFIAGYVGARQGKHIGVEALQNALPAMAGRMVRCLSNLLCTVFFTVVAYYAMQSWSKLMMQLSPALGVPMAFVYLSMIIGSFFMGAWYLVVAIKVLKGDQEPKQPEEVENI